MAVKLLNISADADQRHALFIDGVEIDIRLRFLSAVEMWVFDIEYQGVACLGYKLSINTLHLRSRNLPFDIVVRDTSGRGVDPFRRDDFTTGRCVLYVLSKTDMESIRGAPVPA